MIDKNDHYSEIEAGTEADMALPPVAMTQTVMTGDSAMARDPALESGIEPTPRARRAQRHIFASVLFALFPVIAAAGMTLHMQGNAWLAGLMSVYVDRPLDRAGALFDTLVATGLFGILPMFALTFFLAKRLFPATQGLKGLIFDALCTALATFCLGYMLKMVQTPALDMAKAIPWLVGPADRIRVFGEGQFIFIYPMFANCSIMSFTLGSLALRKGTDKAIAERVIAILIPGLMAVLTLFATHIHARPEVRVTLTPDAEVLALMEHATPASVGHKGAVEALQAMIEADTRLSEASTLGTPFLMGLLDIKPAPSTSSGQMHGWNDGAEMSLHCRVEDDVLVHASTMVGGLPDMADPHAPAADHPYQALKVFTCAALLMENGVLPVK